VISVGNITVGGTGKTPFVEYLIRLLSKEYSVAVLSHGYKRTTKGFLFVDDNVTPAETGDESYLIKRKFPEIVVAVDANKVNGITQIRKKYPDTQIILLDDAFQYRRILPNLSILLTDYNRPMYRDSMLPGGRLREWLCFVKRADVMVVTKSPINITPTDRYNIEKHYAGVFPFEIFFATIGYGEPLPVFSTGKSLSTENIKTYEILLVTGIANPKPFEAYIRQYATSLQTIFFPDHHPFSENDIIRISEKFKENIIMITTEKDAVRLQKLKIPEMMANRCYYVPIEVKFTDEEKGCFDKKVTSTYPQLKRHK